MSGKRRLVSTRPDSTRLDSTSTRLRLHSTATRLGSTRLDFESTSSRLRPDPTRLDSTRPDFDPNSIRFDSTRLAEARIRFEPTRVDSTAVRIDLLLRSRFGLSSEFRICYKCSPCLLTTSRCQRVSSALLREAQSSSPTCRRWMWTERDRPRQFRT